MLERELPFDGSEQEWIVEGRREAEAAAKPARVARLLARQKAEKKKRKERMLKAREKSGGVMDRKTGLYTPPI